MMSSHSFFLIMIVYTLFLEDSCYYVGRVANKERLEERVEQHTRREGAQWTQLHRVLRVADVIDDAEPMDEDAQVIKLAAEHGVDKVRGRNVLYARPRRGRGQDPGEDD